MKKLVLGMLTVSMITPVAYAESILDQGTQAARQVKADAKAKVKSANNFLKNSVYTNPATDSAANLVLAKGLGGLALSLGLRLENRTQAKEIAKLDKVKNEKAVVLETLSSNLEAEKAILSPIQHEIAYMQNHINDPAKSLLSLREQLSADQKGLVETVESSKTQIVDLNQKVSALRMDGVKPEEQATLDALTDELGKAKVSLNSVAADLSEVDLAIKEGNRVPRFKNSEAALSRVVEQSAVVSRLEQQVASAQSESKIAADELIKKLSFTSRSARGIVRGIGHIGTAALFADAAGDFYVIEFLGRNPEGSSSITLLQKVDATETLRQLRVKAFGN